MTLQLHSGRVRQFIFKCMDRPETKEFVIIMKTQYLFNLNGGTRAAQLSVHERKFWKTKKKLRYQTEKIVNFQIVNELKEPLIIKNEWKIIRTNGIFFKRMDNFINLNA